MVPREAFMSAVSFQVGDKAFYAGFGVCEVVAIEEKQLTDQVMQFYVMQAECSGTRLYVPCQNPGKSGVRPLLTPEQARRVVEILRQPPQTSVMREPWSRRFRFFTQRIKTGQPEDLALIVRCLYETQKTKTLSFGEKKLFMEARTHLRRELELVFGGWQNVPFGEELLTILGSQELPRRSGSGLH